MITRPTRRATQLLAVCSAAALAVTMSSSSAFAGGGHGHGHGHGKPKPPKPPTRHSTHRPTVSISNLGRIDPLPYGNGLPEVAEIHAVSAQSLKDPFAFVLSSYGGRTAIDLQYSEEKLTRGEAEAMLAAVHQKLAVFAEKIRISQDAETDR